MKKKHLTGGDDLSHFKRLLFIMKLTILLMFMGLMTVSASIYSQSTRLSLELNHVSVLDLFKQIEAQSEFVFIYKNEVIDVNKKVDIKADALTVDQILDEAFKDLGLKYEIIKKQIIVTAEHVIPTAKPEKLLQKEQQPSQKKQLKGKVTSATGESIPGTTVLVKGTSDGVNTDLDGNFTIDVPLNAKTLVFSFVGMKTQEIPIGSVTTFNVTLKEETYAIDEVVTVGYGVKKKRDVIGSVAKVEGKDIAADPANGGFVQGLQGRATGVSISGDQIRIRGIGSISNSSDPLYVVDGVITNDALSLISNNDIESIDIQKDAAATSIYGSRATNGVIIITTKSGKGAKKSSFSIDASTGVQNYATEGYKLANSSEYLNTMRQATINASKDPNAVFDVNLPYSWNVQMPVKMTDSLANATNNNWQKLATRDRNLLKLIDYAGKFYDMNISGNKASDNSNTYLSINYRNEEGMSLGNSNDRIIGKLGFNFTPIRNVKLSFVTSNMYRKNRQGANYEGNSFGWLPYTPAHDNSFTGYWNPANNPLAHADRSLADVFDEHFRSYGNLGLEILVPWVEGLSIKGNAGWDYANNRESKWFNEYMLGGDLAQSGAQEPYSSERKNSNYNILLNSTLNFNRTFNEHHIDFVFGAERQKKFGNESYIYAHNMPGIFHEIGYLDASKILDVYSVDYTNEEYLLAYFGRLSYSFKGKYMLEGSFRRDGFSKFENPDKRWGTFPSIGFGYLISDEEFFKVSWLNMLKIRGSIGQTGNSQLSISNPSVDEFKLNTNGVSYMGLPIVYLSSIGNYNAGWETSTKTDVGIDYGLFENRINGSMAYFINNIDGLLLEAPLPVSSGLSTYRFGATTNGGIWTNIGSLQNKGFEFSINATPIKTKNFSWEVSFNHTLVNNKITNLIPEVDTKGTGIIVNGNIITKTGLPISTYYVPEWAGVDSNTGAPQCWQIDSVVYATTGETVRTGKKLFMSATNGQNNRIVQKDKSAMPKWFGGFFNSFKYKDFDLGLNFTYSGGNYVMDNNLSKSMIILNALEPVISGRLDNSWATPGDIKAYPQVMLGNQYYVDENGNPTSSSRIGAFAGPDTRMLINGDYLKLQNIILGYSLSNSLSKKICLEGLRVYGTITNVFTLSELQGNPEVMFQNSKGNISGLAANFAPTVRTYSLGLSVKF